MLEPWRAIKRWGALGIRMVDARGKAGAKGQRERAATSRQASSGVSWRVVGACSGDKAGLAGVELARAVRDVNDSRQRLLSHV